MFTFTFLASSLVVWKRTVLRYVGPPDVCAGAGEEEEEIGREVDVELAEEVEEYGGSSDAGGGDISEDGEMRRREKK